MFQEKIDLLWEKLEPLEKWSWLFKRIIYIACFVWLCYLDHVIGSATGAKQYGLKNYTGIVIGIIILTAYKLRDFVKIPYFLWAIMFCIFRHYALKYAPITYWEMIRFHAYIWLAGIYGVIFIRLIYRFVIEKKKLNMNWPAYAVCMVMMVGMVLVRPSVEWPQMVLLSFGAFYLTDFSKKDLNNLCIGMVEGIIIGFLYIQGQALMHRPYDELRYEGFFANPNINALFYAFCYCAVLAKWYYMKLRRRPVLLQIPLIALAGGMWALTFFTMGRTALITMALVTLVFLLFQMLSTNGWKRKITKLLIDGGAIVMAMIVCFVPTYNAVRYIPAYVNDPIYFEWEDESAKIGEGDAIDSEKYIELEAVLEESFGRILWFMGWDEEEKVSSGVRLDWLLGPAMAVRAAEADYTPVSWDEEYVEPGTDKEHPILTMEEYNGDPVKLRMSIYKYYVEHINIIGQRDGVEKVWITPEYSAPHAHNILLYMAGEFGWLIGLLFAAVSLLIYWTVFSGVTGRKSGSRFYRLFLLSGFATVLLSFGMLEKCWVFGQIPFTMFFIVQYLMCHRQSVRK